MYFSEVAAFGKAYRIFVDKSMVVRGVIELDCGSHHQEEKEVFIVDDTNDITKAKVLKDKQLRNEILSVSIEHIGKRTQAVSAILARMNNKELTNN